MQENRNLCRANVASSRMGRATTVVIQDSEGYLSGGFNSRGIKYFIQ